MKRRVSTDGVNFKNTQVAGEREIYIDGVLYEGQKLSAEDEGTLDRVVDIFEDGGNRLENGYEVYGYGRFKIMRKVEIGEAN